MQQPAVPVRYHPAWAPVFIDNAFDYWRWHSWCYGPRTLTVCWQLGWLPYNLLVYEHLSLCDIAFLRVCSFGWSVELWDNVEYFQDLLACRRRQLSWLTFLDSQVPELHLPFQHLNMTSSKRTGGMDALTPAVSNDVYEQHFRHIWTSNHISNFKTPWELTMTTPWEACKRLRTIRADIRGPSPPVSIASGGCQTKHPDIEVVSFKQVGIKALKGADDRLWKDKLSWEHKCAYKKWVGILNQVGAFDIARQQATCHAMEFARGLIESIKDSLGAKASSTLHELDRFCSSRDESAGLQAFPLVTMSNPVKTEQRHMPGHSC